MPNGWEWAILVVIALLLIAGARLSGVTRSGPETDLDPESTTGGDGAAAAPDVMAGSDAQTEALPSAAPEPVAEPGAED